MSGQHERDAWAWARIEAMADDSLDRPERERMLAAMRADERLRAAVGRARMVVESLRDLNEAPIPAHLAARLRQIAARRPHRSMHWSWLVAPIAAVAVGVATVAIVMRPAPPEPEDPSVTAIREFTIAMTYLQRSAAYTGEEVTGIVSAGMLEALVAGRDSLLDKESEDENGG